MCALILAVLTASVAPGRPSYKKLTPGRFLRGLAIYMPWYRATTLLMFLHGLAAWMFW